MTQDRFVGMAGWAVPRQWSALARSNAKGLEPLRHSPECRVEISHERRLARVGEPLHRFLHEATGLDDKLGVLLLQLPGSFEFRAATVDRFLAMLRRRYHGMVVCEPRHASWYSPEAATLLAGAPLARVAADPPRGTTLCAPGGWNGLVYFRLYGSPRCYFSPYDQPFLTAIAARMRDGPVWCIFDNTGSGRAFENALRLSELV